MATTENDDDDVSNAEWAERWKAEFIKGLLAGGPEMRSWTAKALEKFAERELSVRAVEMFRFGYGDDAETVARGMAASTIKYHLRAPESTSAVEVAQWRWRVAPRETMSNDEYERRWKAAYIKEVQDPLWCGEQTPPTAEEAAKIAEGTLARPRTMAELRHVYRKNPEGAARDELWSS
jgi:hypothetical protein